MSNAINLPEPKPARLKGRNKGLLVAGESGKSARPRGVSFSVFERGVRMTTLPSREDGGRRPGKRRQKRVTPRFKLGR